MPFQNEVFTIPSFDFDMFFLNLPRYRELGKVFCSSTGWLPLIFPCTGVDLSSRTMQVISDLLQV